MAATEMLMIMSMFTMYVLLGWLLIQWRTRVKRMAHEERMRALELSQPLPPEPLNGVRNPYLPPLLLIGFGLGFFGIGVSVDFDGTGFVGVGLVALFLGLAWALANRLNRENTKRRHEMMQQQAEAYLEALRATTARATPRPPVPPTATLGDD